MLVKISADTAGSKKDLDTQLETLATQLKKLEVPIKLDEKAITALTNLSNLDFSKLATALKPVQQEVKKTATMTEDEFKKAAKKASDAIGVEFGKIGNVNPVKDIEKALKSIDPKAIVEVTREVTRAGEVVKNLTASYKQAGIERKIAFEQVRVGSGGSSETEVLGWTPKIIREVDTNLKSATVSTDQFITKLNNLQREGKISSEQFEKMANSVGKMSSSGGLTLLNSQLDGMVANNKQLLSEQEKQKLKLKEQADLQEKIRKITRDITAAQKQNPKAFGNNSDINGMLTALQRINPAAKGSAEAVARVSNHFKDMKAQATEAGRSSMGVMESFKVAMEKFPVWMAASTAFFGTVRSIRSAIDQIIDIDSQMTVLKRVSNGQMDVNEVLAESVRLAGELGNKIADVNQGFIAFARQGFRGEDLTMMAEYATLLGNISEMTVEESASVLTAALKGFNLEAEQGIHVVNALNEVDNNYAITTQQLAQSLMRSAGASSTYGVSLEKNIGLTTAIGQVTRESGSVIGNSLKSIYSRINSIGGAVDGLEAIGIAVKDSAGEMRDVELVLDELGAKWKDLSAEQQQNLGLQIAGRYQLSRFLIAMNQYDEALAATERATNSAGSGYRENAEYLKSFEARINMTKNAWTEAVLEMQTNGMGDGMIAALDAGLGFFKVLGVVIDKVGILPAILGTASIAFVLFNTKMKEAIMSNGAFVTSILRTPPVINTLNASLLGSIAIKRSWIATTNAATVALKGLRAAGTFLAGMLLPLAGFMALGAAISFVVSKVTEYTEKQKMLNRELEDFKQKNFEAISTNKRQVDELISSYNALSASRKNGDWNSEKEKEYLQIQEELGELFPSLIDYIDDKGKKHLKTAEEIQKEVEATRDLFEAEQLLKLANSKDEYKEKIKDIKEYTDKVKSLENYMNNAAARSRQGYSSEDIEKENMQAASDIQVYEKLAASAAKVFNSSFVSHLKIEMSSMGANISPVLQDSVDEAVMSLSFKNIDEKEAVRFRTQLAGIGKELESAFSANDEKKFKEVAKSFTAALVAIGATEEEAKSLTPVYRTLIDTQSRLAEATAEGAKIDDQATMSMEGMTEQAEDLKDAMEQLTGVSKKQLTATDELLFSYERLASRTELTASEAQKLKEIQDSLLGNQEGLSRESLQLMDRYEELTTSIGSATANSEELAEIEQRLLNLHPSLIKAGINRNSMIQSVINKIKEEQRASDILLAATTAASKGKLTAEENTTLGKLEETNARINIINSEILALDKLKEAYDYFSEGAKKAAIEAATTVGMGSFLSAAMKASGIASQVALDSRRSSKLAELATETANRTKYVDVLSESEAVLSNATTEGNKALLERIKADEKSTKAQKDAAKAMEQSIFLADKYKRALEELSLEIKKQQDIQAKFPDHTAQHRAALEAEIKLQRDKTSLLQGQAKALEAQIKAGKIAQTGIVTTSSEKSQALSGWSGRITSGYGMREHPVYGGKRMHDGIDIAGKNGTRVDSNVSGTVTFAGNKGNGLGNYVAIKDASGNTNIYGHLQDVLVKAGQSIAEGMKLGTIGSTGTSTGNHLHYQVNDSRGKSIDPSSYVDSARKGISTASKEAAQVLQNIDAAKSELLSLKGQIIDQEATIAKLELDVINSQLSSYDQKRNTYERILGHEAEKIQTLDVNSQRYGATIERNGKYLERKQKVNEDELKYLEALIKDGDLSAITLETMKIRMEDLTTEMLILDTAMKNNNFDLIMVSAARFSEKMGDLDYSLERSKLIAGTLEEGTSAYNNELEHQTSLLKKEKSLVESHRAELQKKILTEKLSIENIKDLSKQIQDLSLQYWTLEGAIVDTTKAIDDSNKKMRDKLADALIKSYKEYYEEKRDMHLKSIDQELEAENKSHKKKMDNLNNELKLYREIIQAKIDSLDKEESERDYNKEIDQLQEERLKILNRINLLSLDNSFESKAERKRLQEDLSKVDETIAEKQHKRQVDLRKENLQDMLKDKEIEVEKKQKLEDERHNAEVELINKQKKYWEQHYTDLLNDEREFAKIKEQIVAGNFESIKGKFKTFLDDMKDTMPTLENTLDGTMQAVGTSIRKNIIDRLQEALDLLDKVKTDTSGGKGGAGAGSSGGSSSGAKTISSGDLKVLTAKYLTETVRWQESNPVRRDAIKSKADSLAVTGRSEGSSITASTSLQTALAALSPEDVVKFGEHLMGTGANHVSTPQLQDLIREYGRKLKAGYASFDTGGFTGSWGSQGKMAMLHEEEFILNKGQTKEFFKVADFFDNMRNFMNKVTTPKQPELQPAGTGEPIEINFHVENMNATRQEADGFTKTIMDNLKRKRGIR